DDLVTGVQTCALPIAWFRFRRHAAGRGAGRDPGAERLSDERPAAARERSPGAPPAPAPGRWPVPSLTPAGQPKGILKTPLHAGFFYGAQCVSRLARARRTDGDDRSGSRSA